MPSDELPDRLEELIERLEELLIDFEDRADPEMVDRFEADHRGRVNLGTDYKNTRVKVAVIEVVEDE